MREKQAMNSYSKCLHSDSERRYIAQLARKTRRITVLAKHLGLCADDLKQTVTVEKYDDCVLEHDSKGTFLVLTESEANERAHVSILNSLWAFKTDFLQAYARKGVQMSALEDFCNKECENANETIAALIEDIDEFVAAAIRTDGCGHFLSPYDGKEHEVKVGHGRWYVYRVG
jgi:hypothetical protein